MNTSDLLKIKVKDVMSTDLKVGFLRDTMEIIEKILTDNNINHVPIVNKEGELKGIVTKNDLELLKDWGTELGLITSQRRNKKLLSSQLASERMSKIMVTITPDDTLGKCAEIFQNNIFHALPVEENGVLVGIITTYDMLKTAYTQ